MSFVVSYVSCVMFHFSFNTYHACHLSFLNLHLSVHTVHVACQVYCFTSRMYRVSCRTSQAALHGSNMSVLVLNLICVMVSCSFTTSRVVYRVSSVICHFSCIRFYVGFGHLVDNCWAVIGHALDTC